MTLNLQVTSQGHVHRFNVTTAHRGWNVIAEHDSAVVYAGHRPDWSLVESDLQLFNTRAGRFSGVARTWPGEAKP